MHSNCCPVLSADARGPTILPVDAERTTTERAADASIMPLLMSAEQSCTSRFQVVGGFSTTVPAKPGKIMLSLP
jgi:hypothetical protein